MPGLPTQARGDRTDAQRQLHDLVTSLITDAVQSGDLRADIPPAELASYCLHPLDAVAGLPSEAAVGRLVTITLAGLQPPQAPDPASQAGE